MSDKLGIGIVGLDHWYTANTLAGQITAHPDCDLVGVADSDVEHARQVAAKVGVPDRAVGDWRRLLEDDKVQVIASFVSCEQNPEVCIAAAEHGKHVISVKPLARTLEEAGAIVGAVERNGVSFTPGESRRRLAPASQRLKEWLTEGRFGVPISGEASLWATLPSRWPGDPDPGWFVEPERTVGGAWIDHSIYSLDLLRWLLQEEVAAISGVVANHKHRELAVEDYGVATVTFEGGFVATVEDTWTGPPGGVRTTLQMVGTEGVLVQDSAQQGGAPLSIFAGGEGWTREEARPQSVDGLGHLVAVARGESEPISSVEDGWKNLSTCLAFYQAARTGTTVRPKPFTRPASAEEVG